MVDHPALDRALNELAEIQYQKAQAEYWEHQRNRDALRRAMWLELRQDEISRRRWLRDFTNKRMIVGERILRGLYSPNSESGNT